MHVQDTAHCAGLVPGPEVESQAVLRQQKLDPAAARRNHSHQGGHRARVGRSEDQLEAEKEALPVVEHEVLAAPHREQTPYCQNHQKMEDVPRGDGCSDVWTVGAKSQ